jgi:exonuclease III
MKKLWLIMGLILAIGLLSGCSSFTAVKDGLTPQTPTGQTPQQPVAPAVTYADPDKPLSEQITENVDKPDVLVNTTPASVNSTPVVNNTPVANTTQPVANTTPVATSNGTNATLQNVDLTPNGAYHTGTNDRADIETFTVASWNLQVFGQAKASEQPVMDFYKKKLSKYDIIFVQEIRDASNTSFNALCGMMQGYRCGISQREGRTSSKEQIGLLYNDDYELLEFVYIADPDDVWERSPIMAKFNVSGYVFSVYNAHIKPDDAVNEIEMFFRNAGNDEGNVMVTGDLNAGCDYYDPEKTTAFDNWFWLIGSGQDTTENQNTYCAYDRIIVNPSMIENIVRSGVDAEGINATYSDHYLVFAEVEI